MLQPHSRPPHARRIAQVCRELGVTPRAVRYYEEQGLLTPDRIDRRERAFSDKDRARLTLILRGRGIGLSIRELRELLTAYDEQGEAAQTLLAVQIFERRLSALQAQRRQIDHTIDLLKAATRRLSQASPAAD